ncbi:hypothetical protein PJ764_002381 [Klebsiella oxytoca]|nr:hypothetical protein [Klebsiella oxytoca]
MNINFKSEVFHKLYQLAEKQDTNIPVLVNKLIEKALSEEELDEQNGTTTKVKNR